MAKVKSDKSPTITGKYEVPDGWVKELNFFDLTGEKAKTKNTSNKFYHIELQVSSDGKCQIFTQYGPTGATHPVQEWRYFAADRSSAEVEFESIVKSKTKKGYKEIDVAQRAHGSAEAQKQTKAVVLKNAQSVTKEDNKLHPEITRIISTLMGSTNAFVIKTLKCPLGQLSNDQIDAGRNCLVQAKSIITQGIQSANQDDLKRITNDFYSLIPHNFGSGARGQMTHLLLDTKEKIDQKEYDLDTLLDAKLIGSTLTSNSTYDQYVSLETEFSFIDHNDSLFKWLNDMIQHTRAANHNHLGKIVLLNAWDIQRRNERDSFVKSAISIAGECGKQIIPDQMKDLVLSRKDIDNQELYRKANVIPLFHGTRTQNISSILKQGMMIRPSGVVITGNMYGNAIYKSSSSSKSINYTNIKTSYWAQGTDDRAFLFISDCALGNQFIATKPGQYTLQSITPYHSVWAKGGQSGVINDEMMLYRTNQHNFRYLLEFTCQRD